MSKNTPNSPPSIESLVNSIVNVPILQEQLRSMVREDEEEGLEHLSPRQRLARHLQDALDMLDEMDDDQLDTQANSNGGRPPNQGPPPPPPGAGNAAS
mmetsp:Transcript_14612/g.30186  ORF Transcript_14612/g.30186 Transcript_14612/m.30186 type:complete len:98 (+) Transcript_14612:197-490(+)